MGRKLRAYQQIRNCASVRNLPPYTYIYNDDQNPPYIEHTIIPDIEAVNEAVNEGDVELVSDRQRGRDWADLGPDYRGLVLHESDHGNLTLYYHFRNGNNREIWGAV